MKERKITIDIYYTDGGLEYVDYGYASEDKLENRVVCFLVAAFLKSFLEDD